MRAGEGNDRLHAEAGRLPPPAGSASGDAEVAGRRVCPKSTDSTSSSATTTRFTPTATIRSTSSATAKKCRWKATVAGREGTNYSHYKIMDAGLEFIRTNRDKPFFCYLPITPPHGMYGPSPTAILPGRSSRTRIGPRTPNATRPMVSMVDRNLGEVISLLKELKLDDNTIVFFCGGQRRPGSVSRRTITREVSSGRTLTPARASPSGAPRATSTRAACGSR